jgi:hypothetical protein
MQALKEAGIVLIVILLLVSVRISPLNDADTPTEAAAWTPKTEAAAPVPAQALPAPEENPTVQWISSHGDEPAGKIDVDTVEHCAEILLDLREAAEMTKVIKVLPCSA